MKKNNKIKKNIIFRKTTYGGVDSNEKEKKLLNDNTYKLKNGKYEGKMDVSNNRTGLGTMTYLNRDKYIGNWLKDKRDGSGIMIWANGNEYNGEWCKDKMHGEGIMKSVDDYFESTWERGLWRNDKLLKIQNIDTTLQNNVTYKSIVHDPFGEDRLIELMNDNHNLVAFKFLDFFYTIEKNILKSMIDLDNSGNFIFYECLVATEKGNLLPHNIVKKKPLLNLRSTGILSGGYINHNYILDVINGTNRYFLLYDPKLPPLQSVVSDNILHHGGRVVSGSHCQIGQHGTLLKMKYIKDFEFSATKIKRAFKTYKRRTIKQNQNTRKRKFTEISN